MSIIYNVNTLKGDEPERIKEVQLNTCVYSCLNGSRILIGCSGLW